MSLIYSINAKSIIFGFALSLAVISYPSNAQSPFHDQCERATEDPILLYYSLTSIDGRERLIAIEEQNQILIKLRGELVTDSISQLVWSFIWRPYITSLTLAINTTNLSYADVKQRLMNACYEVADRHAELARDISRSRSLIIPYSGISREIHSSKNLPLLITPFGNGWIDTNGVSYLKQGNSIIDTQGNKIQKIGKNYIDNDGRIYSPFGNGYIDSSSSYSIKRFGHGYIDSNGNNVQPFGKGWIVR